MLVLVISSIIIAILHDDYCHDTYCSYKQRTEQQPISMMASTAGLEMELLLYFKDTEAALVLIISAAAYQPALHEILRADVMLILFVA